MYCTWEELGNAYIDFVGNSEANSPIGRLRHRWEDDIKLNPKKIRYVNIDCINLARDWDYCWAVMTKILELEVVRKARNIWTKLTILLSSEVGLCSVDLIILLP